MSMRNIGFYWIRLYKEWQPAMWDGLVFKTCGDGGYLTEKEVDEIDETPITR